LLHESGRPTELVAEMSMGTTDLRRVGGFRADEAASERHWAAMFDLFATTLR